MVNRNLTIPSHLIAKANDSAAETLLDDWQWLIQSKFSPVVMTALGDYFLSDETGRIHFLDLMCGECTQVAAFLEEFDALCNDRELRRRWFVGFLVMELRKLHGELEIGQCFGCKIPLSLNGKLEASNFERTDIGVHYSVLGQLQQQVKSLPPGTKIQNVRIE